MHQDQASERERALEAGQEMWRARMGGVIVEVATEIVERRSAGAERSGATADDWPDAHQLAAGAVRYMARPVRLEAILSDAQSAVAFVSSHDAPRERETALREVYRLAGAALSRSEISTATVQRHMLTSLALHPAEAEPWLAELAAIALEEHVVVNRGLYFELVTRPLMSAAQQQPSPDFFAPDQADLACDLLYLLSSALREGLQHRSRIDPFTMPVELPTGPDGVHKRWSPLALGLEAIRSALFVPLDATMDIPPPQAPSESPSLHLAGDVPRDSDAQRRVQAIVTQAQRRLAHHADRAVSLNEVAAAHPSLQNALATWPDEVAYRSDLQQRAVRKSFEVYEAGLALDLHTLWDPDDPEASARRSSRTFGELLATSETRHDEFLRRLPFFTLLGDHEFAHQSPEIATLMEDEMIMGRQEAIAAYRAYFELIHHSPDQEWFGGVADDTVFDVYAGLLTAMIDGLKLRQSFDPKDYSIEVAVGDSTETWGPLSLGIYALANLFFSPTD